jgi:hypothetical protein
VTNEDAGFERILGALIEAAVQNGHAVVARDHRWAAATANVVADAFRDLSSARRGRDAIVRLVSHPEPSVRLRAAVLGRDVVPEAAVRALRSVGGPLEDHAAIILRQWQAGWDARPLPLYRCPVCGWPDLFDVPIAYSHEICPSCGIQFGYDDATPAGKSSRTAVHEAWRERWVAEGMRFSSNGGEPRGWDPEEQVRAAGLR